MAIGPHGLAAAAGAAKATVALRRFARKPAPEETSWSVPAHTALVFHLPQDDLKRPWVAEVTSSSSARLCALP